MGGGGLLKPFQPHPVSRVPVLNADYVLTNIARRNCGYTGLSADRGF